MEGIETEWKMKKKLGEEQGRESRSQVKKQYDRETFSPYATLDNVLGGSRPGRFGYFSQFPAAH